eukprot:m.21457 g.21457  ORF g.21457 m.21457 type:complete len:147 (+) comp13406_c0_seq1:340-780(+)
MTMFSFVLTCVCLVLVSPSVNAQDCFASCLADCVFVVKPNAGPCDAPSNNLPASNSLLPKGFNLPAGNYTMEKQVSTYSSGSFAGTIETTQMFQTARRCGYCCEVDATGISCAYIGNCMGTPAWSDILGSPCATASFVIDSTNKSN